MFEIIAYKVSLLRGGSKCSLKKATVRGECRRKSNGSYSPHPKKKICGGERLSAIEFYYSLE